MQASPDLIRFLETISYNALPCLESESYDGWLIRFANGLTGRANSVQTLDHGALLTEEKIDHCEAAFRARSLTPLFKLTDITLPAGLDDELATRGYTIRTPVSVQTAGIDPDPAALASTQIENLPSKRWIDDFARMSGLASEKRGTFEQILARIYPKTAFASRHEGEVCVAVGLGVVEEGWVGLFDIVVAEGYRRRGHARAVVEAIMTWASEHGAEHAYLQVTKGNHAAMSLYEKLGFRHAYTYWYREKREEA